MRGNHGGVCELGSKVEMCVSSLSLRVVFATVPIHHLLSFGPYALFAYESNIHYLVALEISIF